MFDDHSESALQSVHEAMSSYVAKDVLLYARLSHNVVAPSIFENTVDRVVYHYPDLNRLGAALLDLWEDQRGEDRWVEIEYRLHDGRFDLTYVFPDAIDPDEASLDRRARIVRRYFGDKPIVYPPWDADDGDSWPL